MLAIVAFAAGLPLLVTLLVLLARDARAAGLPITAHQYRRELIRIARQEWGLDANVALAAAQIHQESGWRADARSPYADGLAQFTPATAAWIVQVYPDLGAAAPFSPGWAMRAMLRYDRYLYERVRPFSALSVPECDRRAMQLSAYNGGDGRLAGDRRLARERGADPDLWWGHVELHSTRAKWAFAENRDYTRRIIRELELRYLNAGYPGTPSC